MSLITSLRIISGDLGLGVCFLRLLSVPLGLDMPS